MANNQKKLKAFVRYDGSGRVVAGSLILRKNRPRVGRWFEIPTYQCCNDVPTVLTFAVGNYLPMNYPGVTLLCDAGQVSYKVADITGVASVDALVIALNDSQQTRQLGTYSNGGDGLIKLTVPSSVKNDLCPNGTLSFTVYAD
jgi:hypothetical protein